MREFQPLNFEHAGLDAVSEQVLSRRDQKAANRQWLVAALAVAAAFGFLLAVVFQ